AKGVVLEVQHVVIDVVFPAAISVGTEDLLVCEEGGRADEDNDADSAENPFQERRRIMSLARSCRLWAHVRLENEPRRRGADRGRKSQYDDDLHRISQRQSLEPTEGPADERADRESEHVAVHAELHEHRCERAILRTLVLTAKARGVYERVHERERERRKHDGLPR